jgi:catecholate siderophore receptor
VHYHIDQSNSVKLNIDNPFDNPFDKVYYNTLYRGFAAPGLARSVHVTLMSKF